MIHANQYELTIYVPTLGIDIFNGDPYAGRQISSHANSATCFKLIAHWIRECIAEHKHCKRVVCPYSWTDDFESWARSPSYVSSSGSEVSGSSPAVGSLSTENLHSIGPPAVPEVDFDTSDSDTSGRPTKRARTSPPSPTTQPEDPGNVSARFGQSPTTKQSNQQRLKEAAAKQLAKTSSLEKRSPLSKGVLCSTEHAPKRGKDGSIDDGCYQLYPRSEQLRDMQISSWRYSSVNMPAESAPLLPTRYIHVDSNPPQLCLADSDSRGYYIALSHCWGKSRPLVTTTATLADHMKGIPVKNMPQTFRDALVIARELGLEYLWIDSLCILQDSREDWEKESARMGSVYGNAFLTISAGASDDSEQGIFRPRPVRPGPPVEVRCNDSDFEPIYIDYRANNTPFEEPQSTDSRAWCFQEMALSPRVIVYGREMLGWLCDSTTDVEHGSVAEHEEDPSPPLLAPRLNSKPAENPLQNAGSLFELFHYSHERERQVGRWASMVNAFSRRKLTRESDRLPALSGIVKELQLQTGDEYLAGLWRQDIWHDLQWDVDILFADKDAEWRRPVTYRAPSWSWASIEGPIYMDLHPSELEKAHGDVSPPADDVRLLDAKIYTVGHNPYGELRGGYLKLSTRLWKAVLRPRQNSQYTNPKYWLQPEKKWRDKRRVDRSFEVQTPDGMRMGMCTIDMPDERDWDATDLWWAKLDVHSSGLLITKADGEDAFVRVGTASASGEKPNDSPQFPETEIVEIILI